MTLIIGLLYYLEKPCVYSWQLASGGSRCGGMTASVRLGGKDPTEFWLFIWSLFLCGSICMLYQAHMKMLDSYRLGNGFLWSI